MTELKTKPTNASVDAFLDTLDERRRADCKMLVRIMSEATGELPRMWGSSIVGFGTHRYENASGRGTDWFIAGFSPRKKDLTLYLLPAVRQYPKLLEKLGRHSTGTSCLYIKRLDDVDVNVLAQLVTTAVQDLRGGRKAPRKEA